MGRLQQWRKQRGWTLEETGAVAGYTRSMMSKIEKGERQLTPEAAVRIARALKVPVRELLAAGDK
jgi:transcriptional regulator with XRE-family HTH domain